MRNLLLVTRNFAPTSHVSVERATKLAKYLPDFGWRPTILTGARAASGLPADETLLDQVPGVEIIRARAPEFSRFYRGQATGGGGAPALRGAPQRGAWHPKAWLVPDAHLLWHPFAVRTAVRAARLRGPAARWDAVMGTSFPPTALLIARTIGRRLRIPYLTDFRDSWTRYYRAPRRPPPLAAFERWLEARVVGGAAAVVAVDAHMVEHVFARLAGADRPPLHVIQNGYDEDDFRGVAPAALPAFSIVHTGQLRRSPRALWDALSQAMRERPALHGGLHFWQVGYVDAGARADLQAPPAGVTVHIVPPVPQREAIGYMLGADLLMVDEYGSVMPSKTLQYLRTGRPILAFLEHGGVIREVLGATPQAQLMGRHEVARAATLVAALAARPRSRPEEPGDAVVAYSRREIARRFAAVLDAACGQCATRPRGADAGPVTGDTAAQPPARQVAGLPLERLPSPAWRRA